MRLKTNKVFVSTFVSSKSLEANKENHDKACSILASQEIDYAIVRGCYKGKTELTILLSADSEAEHQKNLVTAANLGYLYNQESILEVCNDDSAFLHYSKGKAQRLGKFVNVSQSEALEQANFTHCPVTDQYFIVREYTI